MRFFFFFLKKNPFYTGTVHNTRPVTAKTEITCGRVKRRKGPRDIQQSTKQKPQTSVNNVEPSKDATDRCEMRFGTKDSPGRVAVRGGFEHIDLNLNRRQQTPFPRPHAQAKPGNFATRNLEVERVDSTHPSSTCRDFETAYEEPVLEACPVSPCGSPSHNRATSKSLS